MQYIFDIPAFRVSFPNFSDTTAYPDSVLQGYWDMAVCFISDTDYGALKGKCRYLALTYLVAHLAFLATQIAGQPQQNTGLLQSAQIDKINISLTPPPAKNEFQWWLNLSPYGQSLLVLLQVSAVGGFIHGGSPERLGFRKIGGCF